MSSNTSGLQTLGQQRAKHAWEVVARVPKAELDDFAGEAKKFPLRIRNAGLLQSLAFMEAKRKGVPVLAAVKDWLNTSGFVPGGDLRKQLMERESGALRLVTQESMAYLEWLVRFSEARNKEENPNA